MAVLKVEKITKRFGNFTALDEANLNIEAGTIAAILGENGAGKTTLMNVLYGLYAPDGGWVSINGKQVSFNSPSDAIATGVGMIHQHFHLADALSVTENIILGTPDSFRPAEAAARIRAMAKDLGFDIQPDAPVWSLPMGMRQRVEILKALYRDARVLILDEPTSVLAPDEISGFLDGLRRLREQGKTILFITHKLEEVLAVADTVCVMRQGRVITQVNAAGASAESLSQAMMGDERVPDITRPVDQPGDVVLDIQNLSVRDDRGGLAVNELSLHVRAGEVLGLTGVDGNGQNELAEAITGLRPATGSIEAEGQDLSGFDVAERMTKAAIGYVPQDRHGTGLVLDYSVAQNFVLRRFAKAPFARFGLLRRRAIADEAVKQIAGYDVRLHRASQAVRDLSGGNQQKIVLARELEAGPRILVVMQATKGLDVGAIAFVQQKVLEARASGMAILYISTESEHVIDVSDRIGVMYRGKIVSEFAPQEVTAERLGLAMGGVSAAMEAA